MQLPQQRGFFCLSHDLRIVVGGARFSLPSRPDSVHTWLVYTEFVPDKATKLMSVPEKAGRYTTPQGRGQTQREFAHALKNGTLIRSTGSRIAKTDAKVLRQLMEQAKQNATRSISIRVPIADLEQARRIAEQAGIGYQTVLKQAIREGLKRAG